MAFQLGKSGIKTITGKVDIFEPLDFGARRKVGSLNVTVEVLPRSEFADLVDAVRHDREVARQLVKNIEPADAQTVTEEYRPELMDELYEIDWQFDPIFELVMQANSSRLRRALRTKN